MTSSLCPKLELKYCERCGALWLRPRDSEAVYCSPCASEIRELPPVVRRGGPSGAMHATCAATLSATTTLLGFADALGGALA